MFIINASLPRAGSTLFSNIMGNHPDIYASPTSSLVELVYGGHYAWSESLDTATEGIDPDNKYYTDKRAESVKSFLNKGIEVYYDEVTDKKHVLDKGRKWIYSPSFVKEILPDTTIFCMIRHPFDIFASFEKIYRTTPMISKNDEGNTVLERVNHWWLTVPSFRVFDKIAASIEMRDNNVYFIPYELLTEEPDKTMTEIYKYLGIVDYKHDFSNIKQVTHETDVQSIYGTHKIRPEVKPIKQNPVEILGVEACLAIQQKLGWFMDYFGYEKLEQEKE
tara:strand:- start:11865 stop:12695 length:831 start_codon:yes stop_codon:yes gene_type:complete